jgi:hypothetical protein
MWEEKWGRLAETTDDRYRTAALRVMADDATPLEISAKVVSRDFAGCKTT